MCVIRWKNKSNGSVFPEEIPKNEYKMLIRWTAWSTNGVTTPESWLYKSVKKSLVSRLPWLICNKIWVKVKPSSKNNIKYKLAEFNKKNNIVFLSYVEQLDQLMEWLRPRVDCISRSKNLWFLFCLDWFAIRFGSGSNRVLSKLFKDKFLLLNKGKLHFNTYVEQLGQQLG